MAKLLSVSWSLLKRCNLGVFTKVSLKDFNKMHTHYEDYISNSSTDKSGIIFQSNTEIDFTHLILICR